MKRALITGVTGQDGSYLAELLLSKGYEVHGLVRRSSTRTLGRVEHIADQLVIHEGDLTDQRSLHDAVAESQPDEVYNLAAMSFVGASWQQPELTANVTGLGCLRLLEAVRAHAPGARFYQASSSEQFGSSPAPQNEDTPFKPRSPYGVAKCFAHHMTVNYRESYGIHASCGILFNHESPRRGMEFVTRKIAWHAAAIKHGLATRLELGDTTPHRDWGYAPEYVQAMWLMLQRPEPDDFVIATGETRSVAQFARDAFAYVGLNGAAHTVTSAAMRRPAEVVELRGDAFRAETLLGWRPTVFTKELAELMVAADLHALAPDAALLTH